MLPTFSYFCLYVCRNSQRYSKIIVHKVNDHKVMDHGGKTFEKEPSRRKSEKAGIKKTMESRVVASESLAVLKKKEKEGKKKLPRNKALHSPSTLFFSRRESPPADLTSRTKLRRARVFSTLAKRRS